MFSRALESFDDEFQIGLRNAEMSIPNIEDEQVTPTWDN